MELALAARDTLTDAEEITARVPVFAQNLARSLVALEELVPAPKSAVSPVIPPPPQSGVRAANPFPSIWTLPEEDLEELDGTDEDTAKVPEYVRQFAEALITGENLSAQSLGVLPASSRGKEPPSGLSRRRPTMLLSMSKPEAPAPAAAPGPRVARGGKLPVIASLAVAALALGFAAMTSLRADGAASSAIARVPHVLAGGGAHACIADLPPRPLATSAAIAKKPQAVARVAPAPRTLRRPATAARRAPTGSIIRRSPF